MGSDKCESFEVNPWPGICFITGEMPKNTEVLTKISFNLILVSKSLPNVLFLIIGIVFELGMSKTGIVLISNPILLS